MQIYPLTFNYDIAFDFRRVIVIIFKKFAFFVKNEVCFQPFKDFRQIGFIEFATFAAFFAEKYRIADGVFVEASDSRVRRSRIQIKYVIFTLFKFRPAAYKQRNY